MGNGNLYYTIGQKSFDDWIRKLVETEHVLGPVKNFDEVIFIPVTESSELCLDTPFTTRTTPLNAAFSGTHSAVQLITFRKENGHTVFQDPPPPRRQVALGVCPPDIHSINVWVADRMQGAHPDKAFPQRLHGTAIIGIDFDDPPIDAFCESMGTHTAHDGYDIMMTRLKDGRHLIDVATLWGVELFGLALGYDTATDNDLALRDAHRREVALRYPYTLPIPREQLPAFFEAHWDSSVFDDQGLRCTSCGVCTVPVCSSCNCSNKLTEASLDAKTGVVVRVDSSCQNYDFTVIADGSSARDTTKKRRIWWYQDQFVNLRNGRSKCTGCGRCGPGCMVDIAHPARVINALLETEAS